MAVDLLAPKAKEPRDLLALAPDGNEGAAIARQIIYNIPEAALSIPGIPGDLTWLALNKLGSGLGFAEEQPFEDNPLGSATIRGMLHDERLPFYLPKAPAPETKGQEYGERIGQFIGSAKPLGGGLLSATTGGVGSKLAEDTFPDSTVAPIVGGLLGAATPSIGRATVRGLVPNTSPERAAMADKLMGMGVPVAPGQLATNPLIRNAFDLASKLSLFSSKFPEKQATAVNRVAAKTMGQNADDITPQVMSDAKADLGKNFEDIFNRNAATLDDAALNKLGDIEATAAKNLEAGQFESLKRGLNMVIDEASKNGGSLPGRLYHSLTNKGGALYNLTNNRDPNIAHYGQQLRNTLDDAFARSSSPEDAALLRLTKNQYKNMKTLQPLAARAAEGDISPVKLLSRVATNDKSSAFTGGGDLGLLGRAGQSFLKPPPTSGTAERLGVMSMGGAAATLGEPVTAATAVALPMGLRTLLQNQKLTRAMIDKAMRKAPPPQRRALRGLLSIGQASPAALSGPAGLLGRQNVPAQNLGLLQP